MPGFTVRLVEIYLFVENSVFKQLCIKMNINTLTYKFKTDILNLRYNFPVNISFKFGPERLRRKCNR